MPVGAQPSDRPSDCEPLEPTLRAVRSEIEGQERGGAGILTDRRFVEDDRRHTAVRGGHNLVHSWNCPAIDAKHGEKLAGSTGSSTGMALPQDVRATPSIAGGSDDFAE